ncbi:IPT/TIG domain-containing protein [Methanospirillum stamsii]|uniref:IPT/TIG domain-containing protein n=1 Tax=Methanospirillum stamsii TaxID=1277351 RepID=UPI0011B2544E|nr:IPT/TIG domain-containing protein [Methanospirillum stamsii]
MKQSNTSNITEGMTIEEYVFGGTVDNKTTCAGNICPIPVPDETFEGIYFLGNWDPWGKGRYYKFKSSSRSIDEIIPAIANAEKGLPIKLLDMSIAAQDERERQKKGIVSTTAVPEITNITPSIGSGGTNTKLTINGTGFGEKQSPYSNADVIFFSGHDDNYLEYYASGRQEPNYNPNEIINWTDTRIEVNVPSGLLLIEKEYVPFPTSSGYIYVRTDEEESSEKYPFSVPFSFGRRKWNSNTISYVVNADNNSDFLNAINAAADSWNAIAPTNFFLTFPETLH